MLLSTAIEFGTMSTKMYTVAVSFVKKRRNEKHYFAMG